MATTHARIDEAVLLKVAQHLDGTNIPVSLLLSSLAAQWLKDQGESVDYPILLPGKAN